MLQALAGVIYFLSDVVKHMPFASREYAVRKIAKCGAEISNGESRDLLNGSSRFNRHHGSSINGPFVPFRPNRSIT
jgi:hypothetical protein